MKNYRALRLAGLVLFAGLMLTGCTGTYFATLLHLGFRDLVLYVLLALFFGVAASFLTTGNARINFWICFLLSLVLTPVVGLIYVLILLTRR